MNGHALTCIDTTTNLVKLGCINNKSNDAIARKFENIWLVVTQDWHKLSMMMVANLWYMPLPASSVFRNQGCSHNQ